MSRYIDVDKLSPDLYMETNDFPSNPTFGTMIVIRGYSEKIIGSASSIDIIHCSECKHWIDDRKAEEDMGTYELTHYFNNAEDFCSYGERSE